MSERISLTFENGVADVRLNRPDKMNALDPAMFQALLAVTAQLARMPTLRAVVLSGEGRAFCSGLDMTSMMELAGGAAGGSDQLAHESAADVLLAESTEQQGLLGRPNQMEAVRAGFDKRAPKFNDADASGDAG